MEETVKKDKSQQSPQDESLSSPGEVTSSTPKKNVTAQSSPSRPEAPTPKSTPAKATYSLEDAKSELSTLIKTSKVNNDDCHAIKEILKEHTALKEKVDKLKSLLGRSAKAQRETKVDFEASQKRLGNALREIERLNQRLEKLQNRMAQPWCHKSARTIRLD